MCSVKPAAMALLLCCWATAWCQSIPPSTKAKAESVSPFEQYAGDWTSLFNGRPWLLLRLELHLNTLGGALVHARTVELNDNGELKSMGEEQAIETVINAEVNPDGLLLSVKDTETQKTGRYLMKLLPSDKDSADLKMVGMEVRPGLPKPKPWRVTKVSVPAREKAAAPQ